MLGTRPKAIGASTTVTVVVESLVASSEEAAVIVTGPGTAGAIQAPVAAFIVPPVADQVSPFVAPPVAVAEKVVALPVVRVGAAGLMAPTLTACTVTVAEAVAVAPAAFVTVRVKVLVPDQFAVMAPVAAPEVTAPIPLSTLPVPPENVGVSVKVAP